MRAAGIQQGLAAPTQKPERMLRNQKATMQESLENRLKTLIVESLALEDVEPEEIKTEEPLFVEGLGLDSIDALELALAIQEEFGVATSPDDERNREIFHSVKSLAEFIRSESKET